MPAIADSDDLYAWLIRGFVEAGLPDHTRGGRQWTALGALNLENFIQDRGAGGVVLQFLGQVGDVPSPEDEYSYQVVVARGASGAEIVVRSEDTLFHHAFPLTQPVRQAGQESPEGHEVRALAGSLVGELRAHNERFTEWRANGGVASVVQRRGLPEARGVSAERGLVAVLESLRRAGRSVEEGPANRWWVKEQAASNLRIEVGLGQEPMYATRRENVGLSQEDIAHAGRLRTAGTVLLVSAALALFYVFSGVGLVGWLLYAVGADNLATSSWVGASTIATGGVFAVLQAVAGFQLRRLRTRKMVTVLAALALLPCLAPCCVAGLPVSGWALYLLRDERTNKVFPA